VSHIPQRKEKNCLNCGATVLGQYCQDCGQENVEPRETFWHMVTHFFYDVTHFDTNFFSTLRYLIFKPGFLSKEYIAGRRARYLHPIRMYVFTSAIFFLLFFSLMAPKKMNVGFDQPISQGTRTADLKKAMMMPRTPVIDSAIAALKNKNRRVTLKDLTRWGIDESVDIGYSSEKQYDSVQAALPENRKNEWFTQRLIRKMIRSNGSYSGDPNDLVKELTESFLHRLPYLLFVSLPLFALILKLVYIRRKQFFFVDHGIFTIHLYVFSFLLLILIFLLNKIQNFPGWGFPDWLNILLGILLGLIPFFYLYKAMRNFYGQRRGKTIAKFLIVAFFTFLMMLILFFILFVISAIII
jgi:hypothetical protein